LPASFITYFVADTKSQRLLNNAESKNEQAGQTLHKVIKEFDNCKSRLASVNSQLESLKDELKSARNTINSLGHNKLENTGLIAQLQNRLNELSARTQKDAQRIEYLESETQQWELSFRTEVEAQANQRFQVAKSQELQKIYDEHDLITGETMQLFRRLQNWGEKVAHGHQSKAEIIKSLASSYNNNLDEVSKAISEEQQNYLSQIELLNERVAQLQQQLQGDLAEPLYGDFGFNEGGRIANAIAQWIWFNKQIPLKVTGIEESDSTITAGYSYSRTISPDALVKLIKDCSPDIAKNLGIYSIENVKKLSITDCLALDFKRDRPRTLRDDEIYRILEKAENFTQVVRKYHNHQTGGKPTLRLMSGTGGGKSLIAKILINSYVQNEDGWEIWLSDPMDGSDEDYWEMPKAATDKNSARSLFKTFADEFDNRAVKQSPYSSVKVMGVFDEFDKQHPESDKERVKKIWTAIRHHSMRLILLGQSSEVGVNRWTWDEMKNCTLLFIGDAIDTAIKHDKDLGWDTKTKNLIQRNYKSVVEWMEAKNEGLSSDKRYRVALLVCGQTSKLLEVPPAVVGSISSSKSSVLSHPWETVGELQNITSNVVCPKCGSTNIGTKGSQFHRCNDCGKSWKK